MTGYFVGRPNVVKDFDWAAYNALPTHRASHWADPIELTEADAADLDRILATGEARLRIVPERAVPLNATDYQRWCQAHRCTHGHCPHDCEHPQPVMLDDGRFVCGRCLAYESRAVEMVPCGPENC